MNHQEHFSTISNTFHKEYKALNEILGEIYSDSVPLSTKHEKAQHGYCVATELLKEIQRLQFVHSNDCN